MNEKKIPLSLAPFIELMQESLQQLSHQQLKANLIEYAHVIYPQQRVEFLQFLSLNTKYDSRDDYQRDNQLIDDIQLFHQELISGKYDNQTDFINTNNLPSWIDNIDIFFERIADVFLNDDHQYSAECYVVLFEILAVAEEIAISKHLLLPQDIILTDVTEAKSRYLRSLFDSLPANIAPFTILQALKRFSSLGSRVGLKMMIESSHNKITHLNLFIENWLLALNSQQAKNDETFENIRQWLIREAIKISQGIKGLIQLINQNDIKQPELYYDIIEHYINRKEIKKAQNITLQGIKNLTDNNKKAVLEDWLARLACQNNDKKMELQARKRAWKLDPTQERFVQWCEALGNIPTVKKLKEEIAFLRRHYFYETRLICMLELLIGEYDLPQKSLLIADSIGWTSQTHPGNIVFPFLLIVSSPQICQYIANKNSFSFICENMNSVFERWQALVNKNNLNIHNKSYLNYLLISLKNRHFSEQQIEAFLSIARTTILDRMHAIVSKRIQQDYKKIAHMAVAYIEACYLIDKMDRIKSILTYIRNEYTRVIPFRNTLKNFIDTSQILPQINKLGEFTD